MDSVRKHLIDAVTEQDAFDRPASDVRPLQLAAAQALFEQRVAQIPLLKRRADEAGIQRIASFDDIVPLLFAHTVYKSYPQAFVEKGRWDRMLQWMGSLSAVSMGDVDVSGVEDIDDFIARLHAAGHMVLVTSGTSGKCSFLNQTTGDTALKTRHFRHVSGWPYVMPNNDRHFYFLGPKHGPNSAVEAATMGARNWARPDTFHALTDEPLRVTDISHAAIMRKKTAEGSATPQEIAAFEAEGAAKQVANEGRMGALADHILAHRHEPIVVLGLWSQHMAIIAEARRRGIPDGDFHPESIVKAGGGVKGITLPPDYKEQVTRFYGNVHRPANYGMTEMASLTARCEAGRYHAPPGLIMLVLDASGERLQKPKSGDDGLIEGRFAFLDLLFDARWGGVITGDKVTLDTKSRCPCGRHGPTLLDTITRFAQVGEDDHIGCAGTIDAYVRGGLEA